MDHTAGAQPTLLGHSYFPDQHAAEEVAQKPQGKGEHNAHHNGHAAVLDHAVEAGGETDDGVGHHIVQQDNADGGQRVRRILNVVHAQQQLDQAVQQRGAHAPTWCRDDERS